MTKYKNFDGGFQGFSVWCRYHLKIEFRISWKQVPPKFWWLFTNIQDSPYQKFIILKFTALQTYQIKDLCVLPF